ncbi:MAG: DUF4332 domain-containing protein [Spirochaetales bacterium]|nr:DUF4332 domain-containing protein [Spirochaetales bacterium]
MKYYLNEDQTGLACVRQRIEQTDLVPSRAQLKEDIKNVFARLEQDGYKTLADLRKALKTGNSIAIVSKKTGIDSGYLNLLRRETEGWFPKAFALKNFDWLPADDISRLEQNGLKTTKTLFDALQDTGIREYGIREETISELTCLVDLTRIQWVSPLAARMLYTAGYQDTKSVAAANAEKLCDQLDMVNHANGFFKGKIGLRDIRRLVLAAGYV